MTRNNDCTQAEDITVSLATEVNIIEGQAGSAVDAHSVPDAVALNAHTGGSANPGVANTVNTIAPTPPVGAVAESHQELLTIMQELQDIRNTLVAQQARHDTQRHEQEAFRSKLKGFTRYFYQHSKVTTLVAYGLLAEAIDATYAACGAAILRHHSKAYQVPETVLASVIGSSIMMPAVIYTERCYALAENPSRQWQYAQAAVRLISCLAPPIIGYTVLQSMHDTTMQLSQHIAAFELGLTILFLPVATLLVGLSTKCYKDYFSLEQAPNNVEMDEAEASNQPLQPVTSATLMPPNRDVGLAAQVVQAERVTELSAYPSP